MYIYMKTPPLAEPSSHGLTALVGLGLPYEVPQSHTHTHTHTRTHNRLDSSGRRMAHCRDLYLTTHNTHKRHPCRRRDSNQQSQQSSAASMCPCVLLRKHDRGQARALQRGVMVRAMHKPAKNVGLRYCSECVEKCQ